MLTLITGHSGTGKTTRVIDGIRSDIAAHRRVYLVVPEQQTVSVERDMASILPSDAPLSFEVVNFTRLADTVFRLYGGLAQKSADSAAEQLTMWRTLVELAPILNNKVEAEPKNVDKMRRIVKELRAMCMTPAILDAAAEHCEEALKAKLHDYALILSTYHALLTEQSGDASDHLNRLAELLSSHPFPADTVFYFDNFSSFTEQEYGVLRALLAHNDTTITLCVPRHEAIQLSATEVTGTRTALLRIASQKSIPVRTEHLTTSHRLAAPCRDYVAEHLYRADYATLPSYDGKASDALRLVESADPLDACDFIAADIRRRVMEEGCRYQDFTIVCGSASSYAGMIDASFEKYEIPFFFSREMSLLSLEPIKMILLAYAVIGGDWRREDVIAYMKCAPLDLSADVKDELELYSETWKLHGARWYDGVEWNMNPFGYGTPHTAGQRAYAAEKLARVNRARTAVVTPLSMLREMGKERHTVEDHIRTLTGFLLALDLPVRLDKRAEILAHTDRAASMEYGRLWNVLCDALDTMHRTLGDMTLTTEEFSSQLKMLFSAGKLGAIPASLDEVTVAEARMLRAGKVRHAYLLGANEGEFPPPPAPDLAFTEQEREKLAAFSTERSTEHALTVREREALTAFSETGADEIDARAARELYAFWRAMNMADASTTILWSRASTSLEPVGPSEPVLRIRHLLGANYPILKITPADLTATASTASAAGERAGQAGDDAQGAALRRVLAEIDRYASDIAALDDPICNDNRTISPALAAQLWQGDLAMTQSRVQKFKECPFSYYCSYVLKLDKAEPAEFSVSSIGTFIHAVLEHFFSLVKERGINVHAVSPAQQETLLEEVAAHVIDTTLPAGEKSNPRTHLLLTSLVKSAAATVAALCEEFSHSAFEPSFFELTIGGQAEDSPTPVAFPLPDGHNIYIYGSIDRVDTYREGDNVYIRVVDYKTGTKSFDLKDIAEGINLQLLLYLFSILESDSAAFRARLGITEEGDILPAAVLYLSSLTAGGKTSTPPDDEEAKRLAMKQAQRSGLIVDDPYIIAAMDDTEKKDYLPITLKKDGGYHKSSLKSLTDVAALGELKRQIGETLSAIGTALKGGDATAAPMKRGGNHGNACEWCSFKAICRYTAPDKKKMRGGGQIQVRPVSD